MKGVWPRLGLVLSWVALVASPALLSREPALLCSLKDPTAGHDVVQVSFDAQGKTLVFARRKGLGATLHWAQLPTMRIAKTIHVRDQIVWGVAPAGQFVLLKRLDNQRDDKATVRILNTATRKIVPLRRPVNHLAGCFAFGPDGATFAIGTGKDVGHATEDDGVVLVFDARTGKCLKRLRDRQGSVSGLAFSPDRKRLACAGEDDTVLVWDLNNENVIWRVHQRVGVLPQLIFSPDGKYLALGIGDPPLRLEYKDENGEHHTHNVVNPENGIVRVWDAATGQAKAEFQGPHAEINALAWSPNSKLLASGHMDHTVRLWGLHAREEIATLRAHTEGISAVAFSADSTTFASGSWNGTVNLWNLEPKVKRRGQGTSSAK